MRKVKRLLSAVLAVVLLLALTACGGAPTVVSDNNTTSEATIPNSTGKTESKQNTKGKDASSKNDDKNTEDKDSSSKTDDRITGQSVGTVILSGQSKSGREYELTVSDFDDEGYCLFAMNITGEENNSVDLVDDIPELEKYTSMIETWVVQGEAISIEKQFTDSEVLQNIIYWTKDEYGNLKISGIGEIPDSNAPWNNYADWIASITIEEGITSCPATAYQDLVNATSISFPSTIKKLGMPAQRNKVVGFVVTGQIPFPQFDSVYIKDIASWCNVEIQEPGHLFTYCTKLYIDGVQTSELIIPNGVETIAPYVFTNMPVMRVVIPDSVKNVSANVFCVLSYWRGGGQVYGENRGINSGKLDYLELGDGITELPDDFCNLNVENIKWGKNIQKVSYRAFRGSEFAINLYISDMSAWCNTDIETEPRDFGTVALSGHFPDNLYLNDELVEELVIPSDVTVIKPHVFHGIYSIKSVRIPVSVTSIQASAFAGRSISGADMNITDIFFEGTQEQWDKIAILGDNNEFFQRVTIHCEG